MLSSLRSIVALRDFQSKNQYMLHIEYGLVSARQMIIRPAETSPYSLCTVRLNRVLSAVIHGQELTDTLIIRSKETGRLTVIA